MRRARMVVALLAAAHTMVLTAACGGGGSNDVDPTLIPGGGVGSGSIDGEVNIFVIDSQTDQPIGGATVRLGEAGEAAPALGQTDSSGLITFTDVSGPQVITVTASGHAASTWFGADGANVTIPLEPLMDVTVPMAHTEGTIAGWAGMAAPTTMNHYLAAGVFYSFTDDIGSPENEITQPNGTLGPANICLKVNGLPDPGCNWQLNSRTGKQAHYALILEGDSKGTATDVSDDTYELIGFAVKTGIDLTAGMDVSGETLTPVAMADLTNISVSFPAAPAGLGTVIGVPVINLGDDGQILMILPQLTPTMVMSKVPALTGDLAAASYDFFARATPAPMDDTPSSTTFLRNKDISATIDFPSWLPTPSDVSAAQGTYSFGAVSGASIHTGEFTDSAGRPAWNFSLLDGRTSFTLPTLTPDALPTGDVTLTVNAFTVPSFDPNDFSVDAILPTITAASDNSVMFTH
jgi:hypothetical protein